MDPDPRPVWSVPHKGYIPVEGAGLFYREVGQGQPIIVVHGGPDFDHTYVLPEMDRLSDSYRLIYYDQRGRGKSATRVRPEDVSIQPDTDDVENLRDYFQLESTAVLGHSWGGLLALEFALRYPSYVSHLILMNTAPASRDDYLLLRQARRGSAAADVEELKARSAAARFQDGDPDAVARYYCVHFRAALRRPKQLDNVIRRLRSSFTTAGILKAREIEAGLMNETWLSREYTLLPKLARLRIPTLIIHDDMTLSPVECAVHVAQAIPEARLVVLNGCGHFSYLECPEHVHQLISDFTRGD